MYMNNIIGVTELQRRFRAVFDEVASGAAPYVLTRDSRPEVVMVSYAEWQRMQISGEREFAARFDLLMARLDSIAGRLSDDEVAGDVAAARKRARLHKRASG